MSDDHSPARNNPLISAPSRRIVGRPLTIAPVLREAFQSLHDDAALVHECVLRALDDLNLTLLGSHGILHPPHGVLGNLLISVAVPDTDTVRIRVVREAHGQPIMVEDLQ